MRLEFSEQERKEILERIERCLSAGQIAQGKNVQELEEAFCAYVGARHAVALSSGGAAIEVAMRLLLEPGQEVLVPTNTFIASATGVLLAGGRVRFADADARTFSVSLQSLRAAASPQTAGVVIVHIGGIITPEIEAIRCWCDEQGYWLLEDAAHAHGSSLNGKKAGRFGRIGAYSFFATKVITTGEGGMLVTDDDTLARRARQLRDYGKTDPWISLHTEIGSNWRMPEFCAAVGVVHLKRLDDFIAWRQKLAGLYTEELKSCKGVTPVLPTGRSSWYKYIVLLPPGVERDSVRATMKARGVHLSGGVYDTPLHRQPIFAEIPAEFPVADDICRRHICLPIYSGMKELEARYVVRALREAVEEACCPTESE